jgi:malate dehydrogenase (quinone)
VSDTIDVALIGGGIMSATLGTMLKQLEPEWDIRIYERLGEVAQESSNPWNNAGTGHAALCELNYTPEKPDGTIDITNAVKVNEQFQVSRQFWSYLVNEGLLPDPSAFLSATPHMSFVWGEKNVEYLRKRYEALKDHPLFVGMKYSEDPAEIHEWAPLLMPGRAKSQPVAATFIASGTDVDFGALTRMLVAALEDQGAQVRTEHTVTGLKQNKSDGTWLLKMRHEVGLFPLEVRAKFVFVGAGGYALPLLQKSGIPEIRGYGGFPVSGEWLRTDNQAIVARHSAKVYGKASVGAPPMSVPHLDTRVVDGERSLLFGPYAGFSPKFLKSGSLFDLFSTIRWHNLVPMIQVALRNFDLLKYLIGELLASRSDRDDTLREFFPNAKGDDWYEMVAGQRVQIIKNVPGTGGTLQFGTEVVASADGSIAGLLGASPGASTAASIMLDLIEKCFPSKLDEWTPTLKRMIPSYGGTVSADPKLADKLLTETAEALAIAR